MPGYFDDRSIALADPYARLQRTADVIDTVVFGEHKLADAAAARVRRVHRRFRGRLTEPAGRFPAGTPWAAAEYAKRLLLPALPRRLRYRSLGNAA
jgi:uncharacterized protein (DUF2236 family)